jgi:hypothetical protein
LEENSFILLGFFFKPGPDSSIPLFQVLDASLVWMSGKDVFILVKIEISKKNNFLIKQDWKESSPRSLERMLLRLKILLKLKTQNLIQLYQFMPL